MDVCEANKHVTIAEHYDNIVLPGDLSIVPYPEQKLLLISHPNLVSVVCLAKENDVLKCEKIDRVEMHVQAGNMGKRKRDAQTLKVGSKICTVHCGNNEFILTMPIQGKLLEVNDRLVENGDLLRSEPCDRGHLIVILRDDIKNNHRNNKRLKNDS